MDTHSTFFHWSIYSSWEIVETHLEGKTLCQISLTPWFSLGNLSTNEFFQFKKSYIGLRKWVIHARTMENTEPCSIWSLPSGSLKSPGDRYICMMHGRIYIYSIYNRKSKENSEKGKINFYLEQFPL